MRIYGIVWGKGNIGTPSIIYHVPKREKIYTNFSPHPAKFAIYASKWWVKMKAICVIIWCICLKLELPTV